MGNFLAEIEEKILCGYLIDFEEAVKLTQVEDVEELFAAADRIREKYMGNRINLCTIINAKSGRCPENCKYCAQSAHYNTGVQEYPLMDTEEIIKLAKENEREGIHRFSIVISGKGVTTGDFCRIVETIKVLKQETKLELCVSLGCISYGQALMLKEAGVIMYHHNIETCREYYDKICDTHSYQDRIDTIKNVMAAGLEICCGGIIGMGESMEQRVQMAFEIRSLGVKSVPVNILNPIKGTPLENAEKLDPFEILKTISVFRFILPDASIRYAGGRNALGAYQKKGFKAGISAALVGNCLTTVGNKISDDIKMITELGLEI